MASKASVQGLTRVSPQSSDLVASLDWSLIEDGVSLSPEEANVALIKAIVDRNLKSVQQALEAQANTKQLVGKEKLGVFAVGYFEEDIVHLLQKHGVSFKDNIKMMEKIFMTDNSVALEWYLKTPSFSKFIDTKKPSDALSFLTSAIEHGAGRCVEVLAQKEEFTSHFSSISPQYFREGFPKMLRKPLKECFGMLEALKVSPQVLSLVVQTSLRLRGQIQDSPIAKMTLGEIQNLQKVLQLEGVDEKTFPHPIHASVVAPTLSSVKDKMGLAVAQLPKPGFNYYGEVEFQATNLTQIVVASGSSINRLLACHKEGKMALEQALKDPAICILFFANANKETIIKVLKNAPNLLDIRDSSNNTLLHYATCLSQASDKFCNDLISLDVDLFSSPNNLSVSPVDLLPAPLSSKVQKTLLSKNLKPVAKEKEKKEKSSPSPSRKM